ncbi:PQQ-dependent sugar dehydrogenase [Pollutimonas thiosulfatoxidans]|uniref:Sorbosone dehydrogenase n=1 Tax=Pollutimonas thiosulfatoxidans TaxID=2028345 RepID=A0A410GCW9_9BURK|nr:PQQ-dependent sugar dehydrogenase [Pollutimonas thiosulfatoxidans]MBF6616840.1 PQQ-dependent sugar dehydrogenase [Candidimonas sp.]NYT43877.1 PQQ-dependent sugar dehydrogenase [Alcaligenaceae bacterium]QAA94148.1 sorbosone dehydrogenase [Pollutimonas thiosulfatoxidans]
MQRTKRGVSAVVVGLALTALSSGVIAQGQGQVPDNIEKLMNMGTTGASLDIESIPQTGDRAEAIKRILTNVKVPEGFTISLYAIVPDARHMAVGPSTGVVFVGTRKNKIWSVTDRTKSRVADDVKRFAPSVSFKVPNGLCFSQDGFLYSVEHNRVLVFPAAEFFYEGPDVAAGIVVPQGELIPVDDESFNHGARTCRIGPDNKLYVTLGNPYNVPPKEKLELYDKTGMMGIIRMDADGKNREVFAYGVRNSVGMDFNPKDKVLWFSDNQVDGMGDDIPPGELNRAPQLGQHFGFPYYGGGNIRTVEFKDVEPPADVVFPQVETDAHAADLGIHFAKGEMFPEKYRNGLFTAQHGSWNRTTPIGARVLFTSLKEDGTAGETEIFADGWLSDKNEYLGRPVDVAFLPDGSMLISDDMVGAIYRVAYEGK